MAINENTVHRNKHAIYIAKTGGGKSQVLGQNPEIPEKSRVILWDTNKDYKNGVHHFDDRDSFLKALIAAIKNDINFRIAFSGGGKVNSIYDDWDWFCDVVWCALDGKKNTFLICEELAGISKNAMQAPQKCGRLMNQGRKYGLIFHGTTQRPQEIYKTFYEAVEQLYIGKQGHTTAPKFAKLLNVDAEALRQLPELNFYHLDQKENIKKIRVDYKKQLPSWGNKANFKAVLT